MAKKSLCALLRYALFVAELIIAPIAAGGLMLNAFVRRYH